MQDIFSAAWGFLIAGAIDKYVYINIRGGNRILRYDKHDRTLAMRYINYGLGAFESKVFASLPAATPCDLAAVCKDLLAARNLASFEVRERFYEIGTPEANALRQVANRPW